MVMMKSLLSLLVVFIGLNHHLIYADGAVLLHKPTSRRRDMHSSRPMRVSMSSEDMQMSGSGGVSLLASETKPPTPAKKPSVMAISSTNLLKNCVGAGVFSLNSRLTSITRDPIGLLPASILIFAMAAWATYNFYMVGETCRLTDSTTYAEAWSRTISPDTEWIVQSVTIISPIVSCLANTIVLTDILGLILRNAGLPASVYNNRNIVIAVLSAVVLFPLNILKDLSALKSVSALGILGHLTAMGALGLRILDKSYKVGGAFYTLPSGPPPAVAQGALAIASKWTVLASLLSYCFVAHYNAPRYYAELNETDPEPGKFLQMAGTSYAWAGVIYLGTMALAISLFGAHSASFALNSFSAKDPLGLVARLAFGTSVLASFPLIFLAMRNWFVSQAEKHFKPLASIKPMAAVLLAFIGLLASKITDIGLVGSVAGGILGSSMMFVFPPIMYIGALRFDAKRRGVSMPKKRIVVNLILMAVGASLGLSGTVNSLLALRK